ncbi:tRNA preQ1(34) S-adenosylmethionine ribosyltransferase-isomerase QueA [Candidatus Epulonipiscium fishelsonii]|uniref:tRNA preQ1(34) S-adenosylmethionine ribosyltransferase-isomerase QueA n=1 Tax=Candidatus Epulonipiscium fishelsonii TaxID=77094 RepID=A0ACC8XCD8_9FIRM|nr:tRNA preQ1(34) S-adenosylmethionine ribosyltransferase-isomerase QueA [Epulopiscium sp. SCG-B11WGA-EpuloA1]ONI41378.1 tRNA preQ1(34) S-adenosylmethionine ribosyltransferase-isomerase QueA [Epulopiscium sp. SCG-B05WGA-EpuloA1]
MKTTDFYFDLPQYLIAQTPLEDRTSSRLMVINKKNGEIEHERFFNIINYLNEGDCLVLNDTRVIPARLFGEKQDTGGKVELLLLNRFDKTRWEVLVKPGKKAREGDIIIFGNGILSGKIETIIDDGKRIINFEYDGIWEEILDKLGEMPLPPYIYEKLENKERYQTVYSKYSGSAAAPTAGLHFTEKLLEKIKEKGVKIAYVTLHVGLGTFRPVKVEDITMHKMHSEFYIMTQDNADIINNTKNSGGRIISVGTTSARTIECCADKNGYVVAGEGWTDIFIYPGYRFKCADGIITNFHLPESTLIMLVSAFCTKEITLNAYKTAIENEYRFFSFGDAMLII